MCSNHALGAIKRTQETDSIIINLFSSSPSSSDSLSLLSSYASSSSFFCLLLSLIPPLLVSFLSGDLSALFILWSYLSKQYSNHTTWAISSAQDIGRVTIQQSLPSWFFDPLSFSSLLPLPWTPICLLNEFTQWILFSVSSICLLNEFHS